MCLLGFDATYPGRYVSMYCGSTLLTEEAGSYDYMSLHGVTNFMNNNCLLGSSYVSISLQGYIIPEQSYWFVK